MNLIHKILRLPALAALTFSLLLSGCVSLAGTDFDSATPFSDFHSWAYMADSGNDSAARVRSLDDSRIEQAVSAGMAQEGLTKTDPAKADVLIRYRLEKVSHLDSSGVSYSVGTVNRGMGFGIGTAPDVDLVTEDRLVVEMISARTHQVVWAAHGRRHLKDSMSPVHRKKTIDKVVAAMFEKYPPEQ